MTSSSIQFLGADAWILLSIIYASGKTGRASLRDIIFCADGIEHAILTYGETDQGLARLIKAGYVVREGTDFRATRTFRSDYDPSSGRGPSRREQLRELERFLVVEPWVNHPLADSSGLVVSRQEFEAALQSYKTYFSQHLERPARKKGGPRPRTARDEGDEG